MKAQIKLGRILGIEIGLHYSWFIIAVLITLSLVGQFHAFNPRWGEGVIWATAITTSLLFFAAIIAHELSHAAVARARRLPVRSITLFALGGVAQIEKESDEAGTEILDGHRRACNERAHRLPLSGAGGGAGAGHWPRSRADRRKY